MGYSDNTYTSKKYLAYPLTMTVLYFSKMNLKSVYKEKKNLWHYILLISYCFAKYSNKKRKFTYEVVS